MKLKILISSILFSVSLIQCTGEKKTVKPEREKTSSEDDKDDKDDTKDTETDPDTAGTVEVGDDLSVAIPDGLAVSVFPQSVDLEASQAGTIQTLALIATPNDWGKKSVRQKRQHQKDIIAGRASSCIPEGLMDPPEEPGMSGECYEFDQDMIYGSFGPTQNGTHDGTDPETGEACLVSFARKQMSKAVNEVERGIGLLQAAVCQAKKDKKELTLPSVGKSIDITAPLALAMSGHQGPSLKNATMERLEDVDGHPRYYSKIELEVQGKDETIHLVHFPSQENNNETYSGSLWQEGEAPTPPEGGMGGSSTQSKKRLMSINYVQFKDGESTKLQFEYKSVEMHPDVAKVAFENGELNLNAQTNSDGDYLKANGSVFENHNEAASNFTYVSFDLDADTNEGTLSYWKNPGERYREAARGMIFNSSYNSEGKLAGCANSGANLFNLNNPGDGGLSIRKALSEDKELKPNAFWHPFLRDTSMSGTPETNENCGPGGTRSTGADVNGTYIQYSNCQPPNDGKIIKWYKPKLKVEDNARSDDFYKSATGDLFTRQCFVQNDEGKYLIDSDTISEDAGYQLIKSDSAHALGAPGRPHQHQVPKHRP